MSVSGVDPHRWLTAPGIDRGKSLMSGVNRSRPFIVGKNKVTLRLYAKVTNRLLTLTLSVWMTARPQWACGVYVSIASGDILCKPI